MDVVIFGATGMVGQGVLRECLLAEDVARVVTLGRTPAGRHHAKLRDIVQGDLFDLGTIEAELRDLDACFFCLGVSSAGMTEAAYRRLTHDLTLSVAERLARLNPRMTFVYVSGAGTDSSEQGRTMWARVKGQVENALTRLPFKAVFLFRPGAIQPLHGIRSKTRAYRLGYAVLGPLLALLRLALPRWILPTESLGQAMLNAARHGAPKPILESPDIHALAQGERR